MTERVLVSSFPKPGEMRSQLAKALEDEISTEESSCEEHAISRRHRSSAAKKMKRDDKRVDRSNDYMSKDGNDTGSKPWKAMKAADNSSSRSHRRVSHDNGYTDDRVKELEIKSTKRLLKRKLASDVENLKKELGDMKKAVASLQPLLVEHRKRKRVSFEDSAH